MICSKTFIPISHKPRCCSIECCIVNKKAIKKEWYERNKTKLISDSREYYSTNKKRIRDTNSDYRKLNRGEILVRQKNYREVNKESIRVRSKKYYKESQHVIKSHNLKKYKISLEEYNNMLLSQNNLCSICNQEETSLSSLGKVKNLAVDHCHKTGKVRGLLCWKCNVSLGRFKDSIELLQNAIDYLKKSRE